MRIRRRSSACYLASAPTFLSERFLNYLREVQKNIAFATSVYARICVCVYVSLSNLRVCVCVYVYVYVYMRICLVASSR